MDFKHYANGKDKKQKIEDFGADGDEVSKVVNKYAGKSDDAIMNDLVGMVMQQRREGKLSDRDLDAFAENAGRMMSPEQQAKLRGIIKQLKNK